ncbi:MAG TPA: hypothetical protein VJI15_04165 [Candidatus Nanoarchaeia archaeon]|nr:hypothetical protein [Candidatus Nanoarchaeia archaeon]
MRHNLCIVAVLVLLVLPLVTAEVNSSITVTPIKNHINPAEEGSFEVVITNTGQVTKNYKVYSLELGWIIDPLPTDRTFTLLPGQSRKTIVSVKAVEAFSPGAYAPSLYIDEYTGNQYSSETRQLKVYLSPEKALDYLPSFIVELDMDDNVDPREPLSIKLFLENRNPLNLKDLQVKIQSEMPEFVKELQLDLPPLERKTVEFSVTPNPYQQPKDYILFFVFERAGQTVKVVEKKVKIISIIPDFAVDVQQEKAFLKTFRTVTIKNDGNVLNSQEVKVPLSFFPSLLTTGQDDVKVVEGKRYATWEVELGPNESASRVMVTNYRLALYLLIALLIFLSFYYYVQSPIIITKKAITTKSDEEGALSEIKLTLEVKNKTGNIVKDIQITDTIPGIANLEKSLELGTLKPTNVKHTQKGTKVVWSLAEIEGHEHRLVTYTVKAKLNILGTLLLPRAVVEYRKGRSTRKAYSNVYRLG